MSKDVKPGAHEVSVVFGDPRPVKLAVYRDNGTPGGELVVTLGMSPAKAQQLVVDLLSAIRAAGGAA